MHLIRRQAALAGHDEKASAHFMPDLASGTTADEWEAEALFKLEQGRPSGTYFARPPSGPLFVRAAEIEAARDEGERGRPVISEDHSPLVLLKDRGDLPKGSLARFDAVTSHELVDAHEAAWADPARIPPDPRPRSRREPEMPPVQAPPGYALMKVQPAPSPSRPLFVRESELIRQMHSAVVLLVARDTEPAGARLHYDAETAHGLVEAGKAAWCDPTAIPRDPRPPVEQVPGDDWVPVHFLKGVRLASRHEVLPGTVRPVPPDEAADLIERGVAEPWVPPPELPKLRVTFGDAA